jgi:V/A-type H+-transporting ATPase subunit A
LREDALRLLSKEDELKEILQLIGYDALQDKDRLILETGRLMREGFLRQNAYSSIDAFCTLEKQFLLLKTIMSFYRASLEAIDRGTFIDDILKEPVVEKLLRLRETPDAEIESETSKVLAEIDNCIK